MMIALASLKAQDTQLCMSRGSHQVNPISITFLLYQENFFKYFNNIAERSDLISEQSLQEHI